MPIAIETLENGDCLVTQSFDRPAVYFDHWAVREFSDNVQLQERFAETLKEKGGVLAMSNFTPAEFSAGVDPRNAQDAGIFFDRLVPNLFFFEVDLNKAIAAENLRHEGTLIDCPPPDGESLKLLVIESQQEGGPLTLRTLFATANHDPDGRVARSFADNKRGLSGLLDRQSLDRSFRNKAKTFVPNNGMPKTQIILGELIRDILLDSKTPVSENDVVDLQHCILSVGYCDFVLIDKRWESAVAKMSRRLEKFGIECRIARAFSKKKGGVERFLDELERY